MSNMKKISILITSYNLENYIDTAIQSVVKQDMPCDWELLVGDDGSIDSTFQHIQEWVGKYPQNITLYQWSKAENHSMNGFRSADNRARLLEKATGDYIIFLDGDDNWLGTDKLRKQFDLLENPEYADCSCCGHNIYKETGNEETSKAILSTKIPKRKFTKYQYYRGSVYVHTNTILFRSCCKELMLMEPYRHFLNDLFITFCILQYGKMVYLPDILAQYNITGTGLWTGAKKVFSKFRNVHLYDLEVNIDPRFEKTIFDALCGNMAIILKEYSTEDIPTITPLVKGLDASIFKCTTTLFKLDNLTDEEIKYKMQLKKRILPSRIKSKIYREYEKMLNFCLRFQS